MQTDLILLDPELGEPLLADDQQLAHQNPQPAAANPVQQAAANPAQQNVQPLQAQLQQQPAVAPNVQQQVHAVQAQLPQPANELSVNEKVCVLVLLTSLGISIIAAGVGFLIVKPGSGVNNESEKDVEIDKGVLSTAIALAFISLILITLIAAICSRAKSNDHTSFLTSCLRSCRARFFGNAANPPQAQQPQQQVQAVQAQLPQQQAQAQPQQQVQVVQVPQYG